MKEIYIYGKDGTAKASVKKIEYDGVFMGKRYVSVSVESAVAIDFEVGDRLSYRGDEFALKYIPTVKRQGGTLSKGDAIVYENIQFESSISELEDCQFCDIVPNDNNIHYTGLGTFSFYVSTVEDFGNRIQANLDSAYGAGVWKVEYGEDAVVKKDHLFDVSADTSVYAALANFNKQHDINFTVSGRVITIGGRQRVTGHSFVYGRGRGLTALKRVVNTDQRIVTRMKAYGSTRNIPYRYYSKRDTWIKAELEVYSLVKFDSQYKVWLDTGIREQHELFRLFVIYSSSVWVRDITMTRNGVTVKGSMWALPEGSISPPNGVVMLTIDEVDSAFVAGLKAGDITDGLYITDGVDKDAVQGYRPGVSATTPTIYQDSTLRRLPDNMVITQLMLPGFPSMTLKAWAEEQSVKETETGRMVRAAMDAGFGFSDDVLLPYVCSPTLSRYGQKDGEKTFDGSDEDWDEVYPSLEGMTVDDLDGTAGYAGSVTFEDGGEVDRIYKGTSVDDNGMSADGTYEEGSKDTNGVMITTSVEVTIPNIGFNLWDYRGSGETPKLVVNTGMCAGREFEVLQCVPKPNVKDGYVVKLKRELDTAINMYFPNRTFGIGAGDHFVLTDIEMPDVYVESASVRLLRQAIEWLGDNDKEKCTYEPEIDSKFMAEHPEVSDGLCEGMKLMFEDRELGIAETAVTISQLTIKEGEDVAATWKVVLNDDVEATLMEKVEAKIVSSNADFSNSFASVSRLLQNKLSRTDNDTANGLITFAAGLIAVALARLEGGVTVGDYDAGEKGAAVTPDGSGELANLLVRGLMETDTAKIREVLEGVTFDDVAKFVEGLTTKEIHSEDWLSGLRGWAAYRKQSGKSYMEVDELLVRVKAVFNELEIRKLSYMGGNIELSGAGSRIHRVVALRYGNNEPYAYRCYFVRDDGTTATRNWWAVGDMAKCQTFNLAAEAGEDGVWKDAENRYYWRAVTGVGEEVLEDGKTYNWADLANTATVRLPTWVDGEEVMMSYKGMDTVFEDIATAHNDVPMEGDEIVQEGNLTDEDRQHVIRLNVIGENAPSIEEFSGVNDYELAKFRKTSIAPRTGDVYVAKRFEIRTESGTTYRVPCDRGEYTQGMECGYYDRVSHGGELWLCIGKNGNVKTDGLRKVVYPPSEKNSEYWQKQVAQGEKGRDAMAYRLVCPNSIMEGLDFVSFRVIRAGSDDVEYMTTGTMASAGLRLECSSGCHIEAGNDADANNAYWDFYVTNDEAVEGETYELYLLWDGVRVDMASIGVTSMSATGADAVNVGVTGDNVIFKNAGETFYVTVEVYAGKERLKYGRGSDGFVCSTLSDEGHLICDGGVYWNFDTQDDGRRFRYSLLCGTNGNINEVIPFKVTVNNVVYERMIHVTTITEPLTVTLTPENVILTQSATDNSISLKEAMTEVTASKGVVDATSDAKVAVSTDGSCVAGVSRDENGKAVVRIAGLTGRPSGGRVYVDVTYMGVTVRRVFGFVVNYLGEFKETIENDVKSQVASKTFSYIDENGDVVTVTGLSEIVQSAEEISQKVSKMGSIGTRNLLRGVAKYSGGNPLRHTGVKTDDYVEHKDILTSVALESGKSYVLQFKSNGRLAEGHNQGGGDVEGLFTVWLRSEGNDNICFTRGMLTGQEGVTYWFVFAPPADGEYWFRTNLYSDGATEYDVDFWDIKLEEGIVRSGWSMAPEDVSDEMSEIKQTATGIELNVYDSLREKTGIDVEQGLIHLYGDKTEIDSDVTVRQLETLPTADGAYAKLSGGQLAFFGRNVSPSIMIGVDDTTGCAVLKFYDSAGRYMYNLGPSGLSNIVNNDEPDTWDKGVDIVKIWDGRRSSNVVREIPGLTYGTSYAKNYFYQFNEGYFYSGDNLSDKIFIHGGYYDRKWYDSTNVHTADGDYNGTPSGTVIKDGWYGCEVQFGPRGTYGVPGYANVTMRKFSDGRCVTVKTMRINFNYVLADKPETVYPEVEFDPDSIIIQPLSEAETDRGIQRAASTITPSEPMPPVEQPVWYVVLTGFYPETISPADLESL